MSTLLDLSPIIPVVTIEDPAHAVPVARALLAGGIGIIELTLRTERSFESLNAIATEVPEIRLGAGSVLTPHQADIAIELGARFLVSPGATVRLLDHLLALDVPVLPGVATVSEALTAAERGLTDLKFFPAGPAGGSAYLAAIAAPVPQLRFCPTGGITVDTMGDYLALPNVPCVGGSWLTPASALAAADWQRVTALSAAALAAGRASRTRQAHGGP
ncbi:MAG TPA: bifunctional 4-hydroxy-2-oxoglutarate aldolase/2-dehydro-3-deoxy-phosphogluconate aldolase [Microlunatus sp.]|nr:bifunctional 4-hydroxy-2-oxoglutarate aldolase/2-dehydro-3-deoxy-phosphogluconate aldolase [Microlunatus sp.]